ncbi:pyrroline-5-carboxylate reductase [Paenibacillus thailandensis]|uniref:Pyrroline-5-carboxylate reductase n=1 Tax=Paenibacillus thailandensis TaxID=393250 RepID=A0ABW5QZL3_9BACL
MSLTTQSGQSSAVSNLRICFYGAGSMAEALVRGLIHNNLAEPGRISMLNRQNADRLRELHDRYGIVTVQQGVSPEDLLQDADIVMLAMKPKDAAEAIAQIRHLLRPEQLIVSVIAGLSIDSLSRLIGKPVSIVRTMPNTSSTIGLGVTGLSYSAGVTDRQRIVAEQLFGAVGMTVTIPESMQDAVTGVSGSGPAYVYYFMESMIAGAVELGFDPEESRRLVLQTFLGAAEMVRQTGEDPAELRRKVTSPNGTTQAAIELMERDGLKTTVMGAVARSAERAGEIGKELERKINE